MAAGDNDPPKNPFVRWKQHVDAHIGLTLNSLLGIPAIVTKNLNIRPVENDGIGAATPVRANTASSPGSPQANPHDSSSPESDNGHSDILDDVDAAQLLEWHKFIYYSPYSPLKLQQQQQQYHVLPPPVPCDAPFGVDPYSFTYTDAFEDLLRASSGRPMLDLATRSRRNLHYQMRYGSSVEPPYVFFHRMHGEKLLDPYFPRTAVPAGSKPTAGEALSADTTNGRVVQAVAALADREQRDPWYEAAYDAGDDGDLDDDDDDDDNDNEWDQQADRSQDTERSWFPGRQFHQGGLFDELDRVFRVLSRIIDEDAGVAGKKQDADAGRDADAEDELYTAVRSAYSNAEKSLSTFVKTLSGMSDAAAGAVATTEKAPVQADGRQGETIQTTEDYTDMYGNRHVKTVVRRLDADGNEIARETYYTIRSTDPSEQTVVAEDSPSSQKDEDVAGTPQGDRQADGKTANGTKPSGWFWK
ncbi:hypothetical protein CMQ_7191 [Grosmannia clavigera kw1407]|uniref:Uncharacterized protein n=1 Tax=Grosmannia clavigera (strain kw1407 / UAMH 11150) TaxID=655863 RepID=F0XPY5_GROCL|nr:uncharacterized protein CMQ_7191 [Grosmannia clavigera kw1407]EFX00189.1 hypothetical protein CMQ_7191 [Grosmannia clavigera kw1407]